MVTSKAPSSRPTVGDVALLVGFQVGTSALGIALLEWVGMKGPTSGFALVGAMVGAQAFAGMALRKTPGAFDSRAWTRLALWAALVQLVLGAGVIWVAGLPGLGGERGSPTILVVALIIGGPLAFGATLVGLRMGARFQRKAAASATVAEARAAEPPAQLVGSTCVACGAQIVFATDASRCKRCGEPLHRACKGTHACRPGDPSSKASGQAHEDDRRS